MLKPQKKKQKQNIDCFYWGILMGVLKLRQSKESRVLIKLYFFLFLQIPRGRAKKLKCFSLKFYNKLLI